MEDREIVAAVAVGDPAGLAGAYDTYAESLYGYCRWMLAEPDDAADAVQDTFAIAAGYRGYLPWSYDGNCPRCCRAAWGRARNWSSSARVGETAAPERVTVRAAAALARRAASVAVSPAARAARNTPEWASPAPVVSTAVTAGAGMWLRDRAASVPSPVRRGASTQPSWPARTITSAWPVRPIRRRAASAGSLVLVSRAPSRWLQLHQSHRASTGSRTGAGISAASGPGSTNSRTSGGRAAAQAPRMGPEPGGTRP